MAGPEDTRKTATTDPINIPRPQNSPGSKSSSTQTSPHGLPGGSSSRSSNSSPKQKKSHDHDDHGNHHNKKSVFSMFTKVKEKAKKLKKSISGRRRREENDLHTSTPPKSSDPVKDDENDHSEYFGSPVYEPTVDKQSTKEHPDETSKGSSEKKPDMLTSNDAKLSDLTISTRENTEEKQNSKSNSPTQSVKEYLMQKFEPGEDERALSQKITQTISPRYEKMKDTMNSFLRGEESPSSESTSKASNTELDITPSKSSSMESSSLSSHPSNTIESNLSDASNISQTSASTSGTCQNQNLDSSSSPVSSNLKPDRDPASTSSPT